MPATAIVLEKYLITYVIPSLVIHASMLAGRN